MTMLNVVSLSPRDFITKNETNPSSAFRGKHVRNVLSFVDVAGVAVVVAVVVASPARNCPSSLAAGLDELPSPQRFLRHRRRYCCLPPR